MSITLYFGVRLPGRPYERITVHIAEDSMESYNVEGLKKLLAEGLIDDYSDDASTLELVYCGSVLADSVELGKENIKPGSTIHVFEKSEQAETELTPSTPATPSTPLATLSPVTSESISEASSAYRSVCFSSPPVYPFPKVIRPEVLNQILEKYPEFYSDTGAFAILRDPVLLEKMVRSSNATLIGDQYPILIRSAKFVAETIINHIKKNPPKPSPAPPAEDSSDSASENDSPQASPNHADQRISRGQLAAALLFAGTASLNSLSNIADRTVEDEEMATTSDTTPAPSQPSSISTVDPGTSSIHTPTINQVYAAQLRTMREMGLTEENSNLQALILCNGNVEAAVTLVIGIGNFS